MKDFISLGKCEIYIQDSLLKLSLVRSTLCSGFLTYEFIGVECSATSQSKRERVNVQVKMKITDTQRKRDDFEFVIINRFITQFRDLADKSEESLSFR